MHQISGAIFITTLSIVVSLQYGNYYVVSDGSLHSEIWRLIRNARVKCDYYKDAISRNIGVIHVFPPTRMLSSNFTK